MNWQPNPDPFDDVVRESVEEISYTPDSSQLRLVGLGFDLAMKYFQLSFLARENRTASQVIEHAQQGVDFRKEIQDIYSVPLEPRAIARLLLREPWEPAAAALLITLCINEYGVKSVRQELVNERAVCDQEGALRRME